jgi:hypothetical protein
MRLATALLALTIASPAFAGGVGIVGGGGLRTQPVYWYFEGNAAEQYKQNQWLGQYGTGVEVALGDRDERFLGFFRGYWWQELAEKDPATVTQIATAEEVVGAYRAEARDVGMFTVGIQYAPVGNPKTVAGLIVADIGSGFLTTDHTEFLQVEAGLGIQVTPVKGFQIYLDQMYAVRWRKGFSQGTNTYLGARYLFD